MLRCPPARISSLPGESQADRRHSDKLSVQPGVGAMHARQERADAAVDQQALAPDVPAFSHRDLCFIVRFCDEYAGDRLRALVHALCPAIYGHELLKARASCVLTWHAM